MLSTQVAQLECTADALIQLARIVEQSGLTPRELGEHLHSTFQGGDALSQEAWSDLNGLCDSPSGSLDFARGLRRQAEQMRARTAG